MTVPRFVTCRAAVRLVWPDRRVCLESTHWWTTLGRHPRMSSKYGLCPLNDYTNTASSGAMVTRLCSGTLPSTDTSDLTKFAI